MRMQLQRLWGCMHHPIELAMCFVRVICFASSVCTPHHLCRQGDRFKRGKFQCPSTNFHAHNEATVYAAATAARAAATAVSAQVSAAVAAVAAAREIICRVYLWCCSCCAAATASEGASLSSTCSAAAAAAAAAAAVQVLQVDVVFQNVAKGELARKAELQRYFGTDDQRTCILRILEKGALGFRV